MPSGLPQTRILALLIATTSVCVASTDLYTPSLPHLPAFFDTTAAMVKLTLSLNLIGFAAGQLLLGPLSDRFGRRPVLLLGMAGYACFSLACAGAASIEALILFRLLQGVCAAVEASVGMAVIYDSFDHEGRIRALAVFGIAFALTPAIAPLIGGHVHVLLGWQANFHLVTVLALATWLGLWLWLPETTRPRVDALALGRLLGTARGLLSNPAFLAPALMMGACTAAIFVYITVAPFLLIEVYGVATQHFGWYHLAIVLAYILGALAARHAVGRFASARVLAAGVGVCIAGLGSITALAALEALDALRLTAAAGLMFAGMGPLYAIAPAQAMQVCGEGPGLGSALLHTIQMLCAGLATLAVTARFGAPETPMVTVLLAITLLTAGAVTAIRRSASARSSAADRAR